MRMLRYLALVWLLGLAVGCATSAQKSQEALDTPIVVQSKTEPNTDFGAYRTWDYVPRREGVQIDPRLDNPEIKTTFRDAVEREMFTRGYRRVENPDSADLLLNVHVAIEDVDAAYIQQYYETAY